MNRSCSLPGCRKAVECRCSVCKTWYCSQACQEEHWPRHSRACARVPDLEWPPVPVTRLRSDSDSGVMSAANTAHEDRGHRDNPGNSEACGIKQKPIKIKSQLKLPDSSNALNEIQNVQEGIFKMHSLESVNSIDDFCIRLQHEVRWIKLN